MTRRIEISGGLRFGLGARRIGSEGTSVEINSPDKIIKNGFLNRV